jgi:hypothetical protein
MEIVKVQRPITSSMNMAGPPWLIYAKGRKHSEQRPAKAIPQPIKDAMGADPKAYFAADWSPSVGPARRAPRLHRVAHGKFVVCEEGCCGHRFVWPARK